MNLDVGKSYSESQTNLDKDDSTSDLRGQLERNITIGANALGLLGCEQSSNHKGFETLGAFTWSGFAVLHMIYVSCFRHFCS